MNHQDTMLPLYFRFVSDWIRRAVGTFCQRLATSLLLATAISIPLALLTWQLVAPPATSSTNAAFIMETLTVVCFLAAGVLWAVHRAYGAAVERILTMFAEQSVELLDTTCDWLWTKCPLHDKGIAVVDARNVLQSLRGGTRLTPAEKTEYFRLPRRLLQTAMRRCVRAELAMADELLNTLEQNGEAHVSALSLKQHLQDRVIQGVADIARAHVRSFEIASALIAFLLILMANCRRKASASLNCTRVIQADSRPTAT